MACGNCKKGNSVRHLGTSGDLSQFAFLSPRQLRLLKEKEAVKPPTTDGDT